MSVLLEGKFLQIPEFVVAKKISDEISSSPLLVGGTILVAVAIALIVTLVWYFWYFGKVP